MHSSVLTASLPGLSHRRALTLNLTGSAVSNLLPGGGAAGALVSLNRADVAAFDTLPGVGPVLAQRIVDWRTAHGRFTAVDELGEVTGIGDKLLAQLRPLVTIALPAYQILLATSREVKSAKDLEGLKMRTTGGAMDLMMRSIGGVPVRMAAPEIYESLTRGTLDGIIFSYQSSVSYDFGKILKSGTEGLNFGTAIFTYSIGENKFRSLPENVRKALVEAGEQTTREGCKRFEDGEKAAAEKIKSQGMKIINFSDADKKLFDTAFKAVADDWVKDINKRGKPGTEVFKAFTEALSANH